MTTFARYEPDGRALDLGALSGTDHALITSLHGQIHRGDCVLTCLEAGGDPEMHVYRSPMTGDYFARHFAGGGHGSHAVVRESDEHRRGKDYWLRGFDAAGLEGATEVSTNNRTRLDVAAFGGLVPTGVEIQWSQLTTAQAKRRTTQTMRATGIIGKNARPLTKEILPVWFSPSQGRPSWLYEVPTVEARGLAWDFLPPSRSVMAEGVRRIEQEKCTPGSRWAQCPVTGRNWCRGWHPLQVVRTGLTIDEVAALVPAGQLVPLRYFTGAVYLTDRESSSRYAELGGDGRFVAGTAQFRRLVRSARPCGYQGHSPSRPVQAMPGSPRVPELGPRRICRSCRRPFRSISGSEFCYDCRRSSSGPEWPVRQAP
jgi:hypothetical protein